MNRRVRFAAALFATCTAAAFAKEGATTPSPMALMVFTADCANSRLPTQGQVAESTGLHNLGQVYAARERLMAAIGSACRPRGVARVRLPTRSLAQGQPRIVAVVRQAR